MSSIPTSTYRDLQWLEDTSSNKKSPPQCPEVVQKARKNIMDCSTDSKVCDHNRETSRDIEDSYSDTEKSSLEKKGKQSFKPPTYCHPCRRRARGLNHLVRCSQCPLAFCDRCLALRHGEDTLQEAGTGLQWVCPKCRGGCGPGCEKSCCTCSMCCRLKGIQRSNGAPTIRQALQSTGFDIWHDYLIYLKTRESKEEIANRKCSRGWTKAGGSGNKNFNFVCVENHLSPTEPEAEVKKRRNVGDGSDSGLYTPDTQDLNCRSDKLGRHNQKRQNVIFETGYTTDETLIDQDNVGQSDELRLSTGELYVDTTLCKGLKDSLVAFDDMAMNVYLMRLWFSKDKDFIGPKQISITLSEKEVKLKNAIKAKSHARAIAYQFHPTNEPTRFRNRLKDLTLRNELEDSRMHIQQVHEYINLMVTEHLPRAKNNIMLDIKRLTGAVAIAVDGIQDDPANLEGDFLPRKVVLQKIADSILGLSESEESDRSDIRTISKALEAQLAHLGGLAVSINLASEWFSREKDWSRNRMLMTLSDMEIDVKKALKKALMKISVIIRLCGERRDLEEAFKVNLRNELSYYTTQIQEVLQEIDDMIAQALPDLKRKGELALEDIIDAVQKAVDTIMDEN